MMEKLRPRDPVTDRQLVAAQVVDDVLTQLIDHADDFVSEDSWTWVRAASLIGMNVGTADRRHGDTNEYFIGLDVTYREFPYYEWRVRCVIDDGTTCLRHYPDISQVTNKSTATIPSHPRDWKIPPAVAGRQPEFDD